VTESDSALIAGFQKRLVDDLVVNNVLRGAWAEELVAYWLGITSFPGQWSYYDLRDIDGATISVKHSTGQNARFTVKRSKWAWDNELATRRPGEGWRGGYQAMPQLWCEVYVFSWLPDPIDIARIVNPATWRFAAASRADLYRHDFPASFNVSCLEMAVGAMVQGTELRAAVERAKSVKAVEGVPPLDLTEASEELPTLLADIAEPDVAT
jgi:hypothetical protein